MLDGKVAVITGGTRGIGRAIAERFLLAGARVALCGVDGERLAQTAAQLEPQFAGRVLAQICDVARADDCARLAEAVGARFSAAHLLVNNAGVVVRAPLAEMSEADWDRVVDVNLKGTFLMTRALLPALRAARGRIINIASISGRSGTARLTAYCAAKHGVIGLTRALAEELRSDGVQVNAVCPGSVDTDMLRGSGYAPQMATTDVAGVVLYLAAEAPAAMTGACIDVFG